LCEWGVSEDSNTEYCENENSDVVVNEYRRVTGEIKKRVRRHSV
jgi:hypothetical protein